MPNFASSKAINPVLPMVLFDMLLQIEENKFLGVFCHAGADFSDADDADDADYNLPCGADFLGADFADYTDYNLPCGC